MHRLRRLEWDEILTRGRQGLDKRLDWARYRWGAPFRVSRRELNADDSPRFFFDATQAAACARLIASELPSDAEEIVARADRICRYEFDLLGWERIRFGDEIDWHLDPVHGKRALRAPWHRIPFLDFETVGDAKIIWELNRHQHFVTLAKASLLTGNNAYVEELVRQWYDWRQENPYPVGINWASSLEVAFRTLAWLWVRFLLKACPAQPSGFDAALLESLGVHGRHIHRHLSTYFSPNTHLLGEGVALFFLGTLCRELEPAERWKREGWEIVLEAAERQVQSDGMHFEQSLYYHVYAIDFFLHARRLAALNQIPIPQSFDAIITRQLELLAALGGGGGVPSFGDDDGGRVFDGVRNRAEHLLDPLATGAVVYDRGEFKTVAAGLREETIWLMGSEGVERFRQLSPSQVDADSRGFLAAGIYVMNDPTDTGSRRLVIHAGAIGTGNGGHGHADVLSIQFAVDGVAWFVDSGTYAYVSGDDARDSFRATSAHNTVQVDATSQAEPAGPFAWEWHPNVEPSSVHSVVDEPDSPRFDV